jgi:hypothetical protein
MSTLTTLFNVAYWLLNSASGEAGVVGALAAAPFPRRFL